MRTPGLLLAFLVVALGGALSGCPTQSPECADFVACFDAYQQAFGDGDEAAVAPYRYEGECWMNEASALDCTESCKDRSLLRAAFTRANANAPSPVEVPASCEDPPEDSDGA